MNYQAILQREYLSRRRKNPAYSLRAYARDLGVQPSKLSEVLKGVKGFSPKLAGQIADRLGLTMDERVLFVTLVAAQHARSKRAKAEAKSKLSKLIHNDPYIEKSVELFQLVADWYHFAILELTRTTRFQENPAWIAQELGIDTETAKAALERLIEQKLLTRNAEGKLLAAQEHISIPGGISSRAIREHHSQVLERADQALESVPLELREFATMMLAIDPAKLSEAKAMLKDFRRKFAADLQKDGNKERVYCFSLQFFPLDKNSETERNWQ